MRQITLQELQARPSDLLDHLGVEGFEIVREGRPVARVYPAREATTSGHLIGIRKHKLKIRGDIMSTGITWDAES